MVMKYRKRTPQLMLVAEAFLGFKRGVLQVVRLEKVENIEGEKKHKTLVMDVMELQVCNSRLCERWTWSWIL